MTQTQNISIRNALVRITMGLSMIAYGTSHFIKNPSSNRGHMMIVLGAMKAAEGTLRYCPTKALLNTSIKDIMSENGALGNRGNSAMQNVGSAMQNVGSTVGSTVQNMMGGSGSGTGTGSGNGSGLQNVVPEVTKLMKDFAGIGNAGGNSTSSNQAGNTGGNSTNTNQTGNTGGNNQSSTAGNTTNPSNVFGSTSGSSNGNNGVFGSANGNAKGNTGVFGSASGNANGNTGVFGSANGNANGISGVFGSANGNANGNSDVFGATPQKANNNAYGDPYKNTGGKNITIGESSNKNGSTPINPS